MDVFDEGDPDMRSGCDLDFTEEPTSDDDLLLVVFSGDGKDLEEVETKLNQYKELFPNG